MSATTSLPSWKIELVVPAVIGDAVADLLSNYAGAVSMFAAEGGEAVRVSGYSAREPDEAALREDLKRLAHDRAVSPPALDIVWLPAIDWAAANRESFAPLRVGGVWIRDSYHDDPAPAGAVPIVVDAATAFGTGHHATTQGCLMAVEHFATHARLLPPGLVLDLGCGTAILAMAAAKRLRRKVLASDVDPVAVDMARFNVRRNGLQAWVRAIRSTGYDAHDIRRTGPYALILANILARPLARMAPDCARHLKPGGYAVLSGLLTPQERPVIAAHRQQGLVLARRYRIDGWSTLVVRRKP